MPVLQTPDARYIVVRGRLWRASNPDLDPRERQRHVDALMHARRAVRDAANDEARRAARAQVDLAKHALGERGAAWWRDGAPDYNRRLVTNTPYATWFTGLVRDS